MLVVLPFQIPQFYAYVDRIAKARGIDVQEIDLFALLDKTLSWYENFRIILERFPQLAQEPTFDQEAFEEKERRELARNMKPTEKQVILTDKGFLVITKARGYRVRFVKA